MSAIKAIIGLAHAKKLPLLALAGACVLLLGCQTPVRTEFKSNAPFATYHTFGMMAAPQMQPANNPEMLSLAKSAQEATVETLTAKGFQPADPREADFLVNVRGESLPKVDVTDWGYDRTTWSRRYGYVPTHVGEVEVNKYDERTLAVEIFDRKSHELVWSGTLKKKANGSITPEKLREAIGAVLAKFPPTPAEAK